MNSNVVIVVATSQPIASHGASDQARPMLMSSHAVILALLPQSSLIQPIIEVNTQSGPCRIA
jgi:hypothetical protein